MGRSFSVATSGTGLDNKSLGCSLDCLLVGSLGPVLVNLVPSDLPLGGSTNLAPRGSMLGGLSGPVSDRKPSDGLPFGVSFRQLSLQRLGRCGLVQLGIRQPTV